tara:strand:+ start:192 stop:539 length:348 start_codon:yes stop_codon:yes gene_type:complete
MSHTRLNNDTEFVNTQEERNKNVADYAFLIDRYENNKKARNTLSTPGNDVSTIGESVIAVSQVDLESQLLGIGSNPSLLKSDLQNLPERVNMKKIHYDPSTAPQGRCSTNNKSDN